jgi:hypothetical protein
MNAQPQPAPMTPAECDLRDFPRIMIDVSRLFHSSFNATASGTPLAWMVGHKLWYRSWHQVPAASLPDDDAELCHLAELGSDLKGFRRIKALAMRGWIKCSDGKLYHPVVAEAALDSWICKLQQRISSNSGNARRYGTPFDPAPLKLQIATATAMLSSIAPHSKSLPRLRRRQAQADADGIAGGSAGGTPSGRLSGSGSGFPSGSQETETGTGTGTGRKEDPIQGSSVRRVGTGGGA